MTKPQLVLRIPEYDMMAAVTDQTRGYLLDLAQTLRQIKPLVRLTVPTVVDDWPTQSLTIQLGLLIIEKRQPGWWKWKYRRVLLYYRISRSRPRLSKRGPLLLIAWLRNDCLDAFDDLPSLEDSLGNRAWHKWGFYHRSKDLPAKQNVDGSQEWFQYGLHDRSADRPAIIYRGHQAWLRQGHFHRDFDRPALVSRRGYQEWWRNGKRYQPGDPSFTDRLEAQVDSWCCLDLMTFC